MQYDASFSVAASASAFGDGTHPSTRLMLEVMGAIAPAFSPRRICDMGAGSGVLSVAAARLWPEAAITAIEREADALPLLQENVARNALEGRIYLRHADRFRSDDGPYGLILMNLLADPILALLSQAERALDSGGALLLSGILEHRQSPLLEAASALGLELSYRLKLENWVALLLQKP